MRFRFIYVPFLLLLAAETCDGAWLPRSARTSFLLSFMNENGTKDQRTVMQRVEAAKLEVKKKIKHLSKESETLANEKLSQAEQAARERLEKLEEIAVEEAQRLSDEAGTLANEQFSRTEQAVLKRLEALEKAAEEESRRQADRFEMAARDKISSLGQAAESKMNSFFDRLLPSEAPVVHEVHFLSDKASEKLLKVLISLILISAFGNLSGQIKAWEIWEAADGAFGDQYFPFSVDFVAKRILAGILDFVALVLITIPNPAKDITASLGSAMVTLMFGRAALIHEGGFMFVFSSVTAIAAATLMLNNLFLVPAKEQPKRSA